MTTTTRPADPTSPADLVVIGAGVIGLSVANAALSRGLTVRVIDRTGPASGASAGNAGGFAFSEIHPLASPDTLLASPKWLLDPLGPLSIPARYAPSIVPWMLRFAKASLPGRVAASTRAQAALMGHAKKTLEPFMALTGTAAMLRKTGQIQVLESARAFDAARRECEEAGHFGYGHRTLVGADAIAEVQPGLSPRFTHGIATEEWWAIADPKLYTLALAEALIRKGGWIDTAEARAVETGLEGAAIHLADGSTITASRVVIAAGAHSHRLAASLGDRIPLETERGYNTTLPPGAFDLRRHITFSEHGFVAAPLSTGIRIGGAVELGGLDLPPNYARARAMLKKAAGFMPGLKTEGGTEWMGFRPSLPDTLPAIGRASHARNVIYAFGHGHLGLTQSSATADLVADLLTGATPAIDLAPFAPDRFKGLI
ncbi:FAD-dependent oxidoreductase [Defluviimonas sp. WL0024]|uniref:FAD-dependent oxidoreductase n=1 Tax=Albidovulum salinarum TaxID=2984153 RepID=A0ABT2X7M1_9RHOB|nr:FAD-dependent oxidoreductase [Defluviimonas sp. WL0024]MCU9849908.1 FAD-dependent oxidoreductase [Defluviimonas sp. WL0024]